MDKQNIQTLKGFRDFLPAEARKRQYVISTLKKVFESFGFEPLETPALEYEEILLGKYGDEGDKLMYRFTDNGERRVALRYDQTVPLARVVVQYGSTLPMPFKRYQIQPVWRAENTQKGRFREFVQCDIDTVGVDSALSDAEVVFAAARVMESLGFKDFKVIINDRSVFTDLASKANIPQEKVPGIIRALDKLKKIGAQQVMDEIINSGLSAEEAELIMKTVESIDPTPRVNEVFKTLKDMGLSEDKFEFSPTLARGLDYYTGIILEIEVEGYSGSLGGGGRYDNLIGMFGSQKIPAVGMAFGFDRVCEVMDEMGLFPTDLTTTQVLVTIFSAELKENSVKAASLLREKGINAEIWLDPDSKLDKQLKYADLRGVAYCIIIGPDEASSGNVTLKDLKNKTQESLSLDQVIQKLSL